MNNDPTRERGTNLSVLNISDDKKADILVSLGLQVRRNIHQWETRAFTASTWSIGILLGVLVLWVTGDNIPKQGAKTPLFVAVVLFGAMIQAILYFSRRKFMDNEPVSMAVRDGLRMNETGQYFSDRPFFKSQKQWGPPWHIIFIEVLHAIIVAVAVIGIWLT